MTVRDVVSKRTIRRFLLSCMLQVPQQTITHIFCHSIAAGLNQTILLNHSHYLLQVTMVKHSFHRQL